jgi:hypothetical protein
MANKHEFHSEFSKLPSAGFRAREIGETIYFTGKKCLKGHLSPRYASSGNCIECIANARGKAAINSSGKSSKRSLINHTAALAAAANGNLEYLSDSPCPKGHYRRYITTNNCIDCNNQAQTNRAKRNKWARVQKLYGLSEFNVLEILNKQNFKCVICTTEIQTTYHIDHCHSTGIVRGLLCSKCNQAIGLLQESKIFFLKALQYIESHNAKIT